MNYLDVLRLRNFIALNVCGKLNLKTGQNAHFNVLTDWDEKCHLTVFLCKITGEKIIVGGYGTCALGTKHKFRGSQSNRELMKGYEFEAIDTNQSTPVGLEWLRDRHGRSLKFYTYD
jgi:hypothetical protein